VEQGTAAREQIPVMIDIQGVRKVYTTQVGDVVALDGIDLRVRQGDIYGIIGMSGAGKSTLIRCINRLDAPTEGSILIDGQDVLKMKRRQLNKMRRSVAMIFQQFNLLMQRTVLGNVRFPLEISGVPRAKSAARAKELLDIVGLQDKVKAYPAQLSGGQKQRVAIARALAVNPEVLFCDEATSSLDPQTTRSILALIRELQETLKITVVLITHQMEVIREICQEVAVMDEGCMVEQGNVNSIFEAPQAAATREMICV